MPTPPAGNQNGTEKKTINLYAVSAAVSGVRYNPLEYFIEALSNPPRIKHSREADRLEIRRNLFFAADTPAKIKRPGFDAEEEKRYAEAEALIKETQKKQIAYILAEIGRRAGLNPEEATKEFESRTSWSETELKNSIKRLNKPKLFPDGSKVPRMGKKIDEKGNEISVILKEDTSLTDDEINEIVLDSAYEKNIGASDPRYADLMAYDRTNQRGIETESYKNVLQNTVLKKTGIDKALLRSAFFDDDCFEEVVNEDTRDEMNPTVTAINYSAVKRHRLEFIRARMNELPEEERTEKAFLETCENLDAAMSVYVFPQNDARPDAQSAFCNMEEDEYYAFALENIPPTAFAKEMETNLNAYVTTTSDEMDIQLETVAAYVRHMETIHAKRPFFTRVFDYFKKGGEDSTVKRMKNTLYAKYGKHLVDEAMRESETLPEKNSLEKRYANISSGKVPMPDGVEKALGTFDAGFDKLLKQKAEKTAPKTEELTTEALKENIRATLKEKDAEVSVTTGKDAGRINEKVEVKEEVKTVGAPTGQKS